MSTRNFNYKGLSQSTSDSDDAPSSRKTGKGHVLHSHHLFLKTFLGPSAYLLDNYENLVTGLLAPITFLLRTAARLNSLKQHSGLS